MVENFSKVLARYLKESIILMDNDLKEINKIYNENRPVFDLKELDLK
tara:strand:+ start:965 stop:1105 length:141 start_codon:yes stop_codon:yes gene_type:complete